MLVYLAIPFGHKEKEVRDRRFHAANACAAQLMADGFDVFSPISHNVPISQINCQRGWVHWARQDTAILKRCDRLIVLCLEGWKESEGVQEEIKLATQFGLSIRYLVHEDQLIDVTDYDYDEDDDPQALANLRFNPDPNCGGFQIYYFVREWE